MAAIAIALNTFGPRLSGRRIRIQTDSMNAVNALRREASYSPLNMRLLRGIHATAFVHDVHIHLTSHIKGAHNVSADAASRLSSQSADRLRSLALTPLLRVQPDQPKWLLDLGLSTACPEYSHRPSM